MDTDRINYTTINHVARKKLGLSLIEYCLADLIYNLANHPKNPTPGWCYASKQTLADNLGMTKRHVTNLIISLIEKNILERHDQTKHLKITSNWYEDTIISKQKFTNRENISLVGKECPTDREKISLPSNKDIYKDNNTTPIVPLKGDSVRLEQFEQIWNNYPKRIGKKQALRHFLASCVSPQDFSDISAALANYLHSREVKSGYIQNGSTWFNNWKDWINYGSPTKPVESIENKRKRWLAQGLSHCHGAIKAYGHDDIELCSICFQSFQNGYELSK